MAGGNSIDHFKVKRFRVDVIVLGSILVFASYWLCGNALATYDFFDMSGFMDAGYRVYSGQAPYADFQFIAGPVQLYMQAFFYAIFGFNKTAVLVHLCTINALALIILYTVARKHLSTLESALLTMVSVFCFYGPIAHPWYDQNASFWLLVGIAAFELQCFIAPSGRPLATGLICGICVGLSFLTKSNIGLAGGVMFFVAFLVCGQSKDYLKGYAMGLATAIGALLYSLKAPSDIQQAFFSYDLASRVTDFQKLLAVFYRLPYLEILGVGIVFVVSGGKIYRQANRPCLVFLYGLLATSIFAAWTGSMVIAANTVFVGIEMTYLYLLSKRLPTRFQKAAVFTVAGFAVIQLVLSYNKARLAWSWRDSNLQSDYSLRNQALSGWKCSADIGPGFDKAVAFIDANIPKGDQLFVFPDATVIYGLTGHESYRFAPFIFHLGLLPSPGKYYDKFQERFRSEPPKWIVLHDQTEIDFFDLGKLLHWLKLSEFLKANYGVVWTESKFSILRRID